MKTLPYDYARCGVKQPGEKCRNCLRWANLPEQTWGPRTPITLLLNSNSEHCDYYPIEENKNES
jgi:hypothetical protein